MLQGRLPVASHWSATPIARLLGPMHNFVQRSVSGGIVLFIATLLALALANSPLAAAYTHLLATEVGFSFGAIELKLSLLHWINDGLMAIFFFLVGLEIKREVIAGELANPRAAALPIIAAVGGVAVPALIYLAFNVGSSGASGWGIPMATDIAFALGCLMLLGSRIPFGLTIFLTAVAIVDDLIAVLVIALFYSGALNFTMLGSAFVLLLLLYAANRLGIRNIIVYGTCGIIIWLLFLQSGIHATIAGVLVAFVVPARYRIDTVNFATRARALLNHFEHERHTATAIQLDEQDQIVVLELEDLCEQVQTPLQKIEHRLHHWVAFLILPLFALANADVPISIGSLAAVDTRQVTLGIIIGLVVGKPLGLAGASWLAVRSGLADLPDGIDWRMMLGACILGGIGFTMSIFIASLAFPDVARLEAAKLAILIASLIAGVAGIMLLSRNRQDASE